MKLSNWLKRDDGTDADAPFVLPLELEDARPVQMQRSVLRTGAAVLAASLVWAGLTPIRELAIAPGLIVPTGDIRAMQHLEGGIVAEIYHRVGEAVRAGDPILKLAAAQTEADLAQLKVRLDNLMQRRIQLTQLIVSQKQDLPLQQNALGRLGTEQRAVLETRIDQRNSEHRTLLSRISQRRTEIANLENEIVALKRMVDIRTQVFNDKSGLLEQGLATRRAFFDDQTALEQAKTQLLNGTGRLETAHKALDEALSLFAASDSEAQRVWSEELSKVDTDVGETREALFKQQDRFDRLTIRAPVNGTVQFLSIKSVGEVIRGGDTFARIVPQDVPLFAEVQIRPDDIGHVKVGDVAELRVTAFDPSIYGKLHGMIESISASSFQRENGDYYFKANVSFGDQKLLDKSSVAPGMIVSAEIITGAKSFLRYILKPVIKVFGPSFSER